MRGYPRPQEPVLYVQKEPMPGTCPECGGTELRKYPVVSEGGWWKVVKCQACLCSVQRERMGLLGEFTSLTDLL